MLTNAMVAAFIGLMIAILSPFDTGGLFEIIDKYGDLIDIVSKSDPDALAIAKVIAKGYFKDKRGKKW